jgi:hypothetical protein
MHPLSPQWLTVLGECPSTGLSLEAALHIGTYHFFRALAVQAMTTVVMIQLGTLCATM